MKTIAILGGGITGLAAAEALVRAGHRPIVLEAAERSGGFIATEEVEGWLVEHGPNSLQTASPALLATLERLGLGAERVNAQPAAKNRYVVRDGRLVSLPLSPGQLLTSRLFSWRAKLAVLRELRQRPRTRSADVSVADFVREHFDQEILDYAVQPFVSGIYAGDARTLALAHAFPSLARFERETGSLLRGQLQAARRRRAEGRPGLPPILSFRHGLAALPAAYAARLPTGALRLGHEVLSLAREAAWTVHVRSARGTEEIRADAVISTLPARALAGLTLGGSPRLAALAQVDQPPIASLFLGYARAQVAHRLDGFGVLVPATEGRKLLGAIFSSTLFPGRAPPGMVALTALAGGALQPGLARLDADALLAALTPDLEQLLGVRGRPVFRRHRAWPASIPQYAVGYQAILDTIAAVERAHPGLLIGGMVRDGISLTAAIASGERLAAAI